jgi:hypothetical protein
MFHELRVAEVSTEHLTSQDRWCLGEAADDNLNHWGNFISTVFVVAAFDTGWFVGIGAEWDINVPAQKEQVPEINANFIADFRKVGFTEHFLKIVVEGQKQKLAWLRFHADAVVLDEYPVF